MSATALLLCEVEHGLYYRNYSLFALKTVAESVDMREKIMTRQPCMNVLVIKEGINACHICYEDRPMLYSQ
jgi:hypothetical protein